MSKQQAAIRLDKLKKLVNEHRYNYHVLDISTVSEEVLDSLKHEINEIESQFPDLITPDSPSQRVAGGISEGFIRVQHVERMLSLNDAFSDTEVYKWVERIQKLVPGENIDFFADIKMDGLACSLTYENGMLVRAATRGDGQYGEDVTNNVRTIESVPLSIPEKSNLEVRGEIIMYKNDFESLNKRLAAKGEKVYANPRNLASGTIRQLDPAVVASRNLRFHAYSIITDHSFGDSYKAAYEFLKQQGFKLSDCYKDFNSVDEVLEYSKKWRSQREQLPYYTDGLVVKVNKKKTYQKLGIVGKAPRGAIAIKYPAEQATTVLKDIVISLGRTGAATPVAVFEPVYIAGTKVSHASLHNADEIERKDVRLGDTIVVYKAGDIIPQVESVLSELRPKDAKRFDFLKELHRQFPDIEFERPAGEAVYRVKNYQGTLLLQRAVEHYASRGAVDIEGLGEKNVQLLIENGLIKDLADIYGLTYEQVIELDRFAELSAKNLINAIASKKNPESHKFLFGLGIRHIGVQTAIDLIDFFGTIDNLQNASTDELVAIDGVGDVMAESISAWFGDEENIKLLDKFKKLGVKPLVQKTGGKLEGLSFVVTGTLQEMGRDEAAEKIRSLGGKFQSSVAKDTNYLVVGEKVGASKLKKAENYGTKVIDERAFIKLLK